MNRVAFAYPIGFLHPLDVSGLVVHSSKTKTAEASVSLSCKQQIQKRLKIGQMAPQETVQNTIYIINTYFVNWMNRIIQ